MSANELKEVKVGETLIERPEQRIDLCNLAVCKDADHRKLAIWSIICGLSCFGIMSLMYSVKARETRKRLQYDDCQETRDMVKKYTDKALKWGIGSIVAWVVLIIIFPFLIVLLTYIVTFID